MATRRILLVGGGSGGHAFPLIAVGEVLRRRAQERGITLELLAFGERNFLGDAAQAHQIKFRGIVAGKFRRYLSPLMLLDIVKVPISAIQSLWYVFWFMPDAVFSKGGYDAVMPVIAAWLYRIPVAIHESDSVPGLANRISAAFATTIFTSFSSAGTFFRGKNVTPVGNPVRREVLEGDPIAALTYFKLRPGLRTIFVLGGSQGAQEINNIILESIVTLTESFQVIHQCGSAHYASVRSQVDQLIKEGSASYGPGLKDRYRLFAFLSEKEMAMAYAVAGIVVSRAGAGSLSEIAAVGKPAIIIPIAVSANRHQLMNATEFMQYGGVMVEGANITPHILLNQIHSLLEPQRYAAVSQRIREFTKLNAADTIAETLLSL